MRKREREKDKCCECPTKFGSSFRFQTSRVFAGVQNNFGLCSSPGQWPRGQVDPHGGQVSGRCGLCVCVCQ